MKKIVSLTFLLLTFPIIGISNVCKLDGTREDWARKLCLVKDSNLSKNHEALRKCVKVEDRKVAIHSCEGNIVFKHRICEILIQRNQFEGDVNKCLSSEIDFENRSN